ncbi:MAG: hypothetical protein GY849_02670 [Deltaproteobacteria bacterium]|nr:hypothetical protein [Deltaproteobacteria bacterium]
MSEQIDNLTKLLPDESIEFRIGNVSVGKGFSVLAYKTARADVIRLNEVFGLNWKNRYFYDNKNMLCCGISVFNKDIKEWIERIDIGTESRTEKEKGSYSDAFKRAGFKWGIGIELYKYPFIWINHTNFGGSNGKTPIGVYVNKWKKEGPKIVDEKGQIKFNLFYTNKKTELTSIHDNYNAVIKALDGDFTLEQIENKYILSEQIKIQLDLDLAKLKENQKQKETK